MNRKTVNFRQLIREVKEDMDKFHVPYDNYYELAIKDFSGATWGTCNYIDQAIYINSDLVLYGKDEDIKNVICHELIHSAKECRFEGHRGLWKKYANVMNQHGYHISRSNRYELNIDKTKIYKYVVKCVKCGNTQGFNTRRGVVKNPENYLCSICAGKIILIKGGE
jgi:predicted SprT family Zn-dependent metalloprotease|nr:MAG TPA: SprT-like family [Caudoviricetes sp.]